MLTEAINKILSLAPLETLDIDGRKYYTKPLHTVPEPVAEDNALEFQTLTGLKDYLLKGDDLESAPGPVMVHVESHSAVSVVSNLATKDFRRHSFAQATHEAPVFPFGNWIEQERFIVGLQAMFVPSKDRDTLLRLVSKITAEEVRTSEDDGVSQEVSARAGVHLVHRIGVPNPVKLRPYRTFREVEQPESAFVVRVRRDEKSGFYIALYEADGKAWQLQAMRNVADWLMEALNEAPEFLVLA